MKGGKQSYDVVNFTNDDIENKTKDLVVIRSLLSKICPQSLDITACYWAL